MSEVVFHRLDYEGVLRRLRQHAADLGARPEVREVILVGSLVHETWSAGSDADLVVVVDRDDDPAPFRGPKYTPTGIGVGVDVRVYTPAEAAGWSSRFRSEVERGLVLYRRDGPAPGTGRRGDPAERGRVPRQ
jgi:predicted nucleotidyltransferase